MERSTTSFLDDTALGTDDMQKLHTGSRVKRYSNISQELRNKLKNSLERDE